MVFHRLKFTYLLGLAWLLALPNMLIGQDCVDVTIGALPFEVSSTTCGEGSDYDENNSCNSWEFTDEDITFVYTTTDESCLYLTVSGFQQGSGSLMVTSGCPDNIVSTCISVVASDFDDTSISTTFSPEPNTTYYITVGSNMWDADCIDFDLTLNTNCPEPTVNDCFGAVNMCAGYYYEENAPTGTGNFMDILPQNDCQMASVNNMGWYKLTTQTAGILNFTLSPNSTDDYDWILFNLTDATCDEIATNPDLAVSCSTYGLTGSNGETGISTALGGTGNANGPGNLNGPAFNADLNVNANETYVLMISNWSGTPNGYELDFGASTVTFIDNIPPEVESVSYACDGVITLTFSEYIDCATVLPEYFTVEGEGGPYTIAAVESSCAEGAEYSSTFHLSYATDFPATGGTFNLVFEQDELTDVCGNFLEPVSVPFVVAPGMVLEAIPSPATCGDDNGAVSVQVEAGGAEPYQYALNGGPLQSENTFNNLAVGDYTISVVDNNGCQSTIATTILAEGLDFTAGLDTYACQLSYTAMATLPPGYTGVWSAVPGIQMSDNTSPHCVFSPQMAGTYTLIWTITNGVNCTASEAIEVDFNAITVENFEITVPTCRGICDGSAEVAVTGVIDNGGLEYNWSGGNSSTATPHKATQLCAGMHTLTLSTPEGCTLTYPFEMENPEPIKIDSIIVKPESCPGFCDGSISILSAAASEYSFDEGTTFTTTSTAENLCSGTYRIILKNTSNCQRDTILTLFSPDGPVARFNARPHRQSTFTPHFQFENLSEDFRSSYWLFDYPDGSDFSWAENPKYTYANPIVGDYTVMLVAIDGAGCRDTTFRKVGIFEDTWIYIPNSFTPNGDGLNDLFKPVLSNIDVEDYRLEIFDRWGQKVFETNEVNQGWDGSMSNSGYYAEAGSYAYHIHIRESETGEAREWNGMVIMVR